MSWPRQQLAGGLCAGAWLGACAVAAAAPAAAAVLTVGPGETYGTLAGAVAAAAANDTIDVMAGTYSGQTAVINTPLTIVGYGGQAVFNAVGSNGVNAVQNGNDKGILVINASTTIENLVLENAVADTGSNNGAGIRYQAGNLTVLNSTFLDNQDGILATPTNQVIGTTIVPSGTIVVSNSTFTDNGIAAGNPGAGYAHALYANHVASLTVTGSTFQGTQQGHDIKSRAADTIIQNNYLDDGVTGTTSYAIDLSNGGDATITGNTIDQGPNTSNWTMIAYDAEGSTYTQNIALIQNNVFNNTGIADATGVNDFAAGYGNTASLLTVVGNSFNGVLNPVCGGPVSLGSNTYVTSPATTCAVDLVAAPAPPGLPVVASAVPVLLWARRRSRIDARGVRAYIRALTDRWRA